MKRERLMHREERKGKMETKGEEEKIDVGKKKLSSHTREILLQVHERKWHKKGFCHSCEGGGSER